MLLDKTIVAAALIAVLAVPAAYAQDDTADGLAAFAEALGEPQPFESYPKPWPLNNLVTPGKLTVGTTGQAPPRTFIDPASGELTGSYVELFEKIAGDLGLEIEFVKLDWPGILPGLTANRFDLACDGASWSAQRLGSTDFLMTSPTAVNATVALARKDAGISSWEAMSGKKIGGVRGEIYFETAKERLDGIDPVEYPGMSESLLGLQNGQVAAIALNLANALDVLDKSPIADQLELVGPPLQVFAQGLCVNPRQADLLVAVNVLLGNYRADGSLKELIGKYSTSTAEVELLNSIGY